MDLTCCGESTISATRAASAHAHASVASSPRAGYKCTSEGRGGRGGGGEKQPRASCLQSQPRAQPQPIHAHASVPSSPRAGYRILIKYLPTIFPLIGFNHLIVHRIGFPRLSPYHNAPFHLCPGPSSTSCLVAD